MPHRRHMRDTRIPGGTSLRDAGKLLEAIATTDTRNKSEYDDFIGRRRVSRLRVNDYVSRYNTNRPNR